MSEENVESVYRGVEAFNRRDFDAFLALTDPDVEYTSRLVEVEGGGPYRGPDGVRDWWENIFGIWSEVSAEIEEVRDLGDVTVTRIRLRGHGVESDAPWEQTQWQVADWRHGKIIRGRVFLTEAEALEAAGLRE
jgi:ketosteroid isomerase-like protein